MEERCRGEEVCGHRAVVDSRVLRNEDVQQVREEQSPGQQHQHHQQLCVPTTAEQNVISAKTAGDHRNGRVRAVIHKITAAVFIFVHPSIL